MRFRRPWVRSAYKISARCQLIPEADPAGTYIAKTILLYQPAVGGQYIHLPSLAGKRKYDIYMVAGRIGINGEPARRPARPKVDDT